MNELPFPRTHPSYEVLRGLAARHPGLGYELYLQPEDRPVTTGGEVARPVPPAATLPCGHVGEPTGETVPCKSCRGTVQMKVFRCVACGVSGTLVRR